MLVQDKVVLEEVSFDKKKTVEISVPDIESFQKETLIKNKEGRQNHCAPDEGVLQKGS